MGVVVGVVADALVGLLLGLVAGTLGGFCCVILLFLCEGVKVWAIGLVGVLGASTLLLWEE